MQQKDDFIQNEELEIIQTKYRFMNIDIKLSFDDVIEQMEEEK